MSTSSNILSFIPSSIMLLAIIFKIMIPIVIVLLLYKIYGLIKGQDDKMKRIGKDLTTIKKISRDKSDESGYRYMVDYSSKNEKDNCIWFTFVKENGQWKIRAAGRG